MLEIFKNHLKFPILPSVLENSRYEEEEAMHKVDKSFRYQEKSEIPNLKASSSSDFQNSQHYQQEKFHTAHYM